MARTFNLFISHSWANSGHYDGLIKLLDQKTHFSYCNYSIPKDNPIHNAPHDDQLYEAIKRKISPCSVVLILAGVYGSRSKWIDKEIRISKSEFQHPKSIIAIMPWHAERTSTKVKDSADKVVKWETSSIVNAIRELS